MRLPVQPQRESLIFGELRQALAGSWRRKARPEQLPPPGEWLVWLFMAGRGAGKTRAGSEWVHERVLSGTASRIALVAPTAADVRDVMVEGPSGILATAPKRMRPEYEPSKRRLTWPNGAIATTFSADEPDRLRGPEHDLAWTDELGAWKYPETWDMLQLGLRIGALPQCLVSTTPKPVKLIRELLAREGRGVVVSRSSTWANRANLSPAFLESIASKYAGTRLARQEIEGEFLEDLPGALWHRAWIDAARVEKAPHDLRRVVVAADPSVSTSENADECGLVVAGLGYTGHVYIIEDLSERLSPLEWARKAVHAYRKHAADRIVAEANQGGQLVADSIRMVDPAAPIRLVHASRGKAVRAEPVSALYEQGRVHHCGAFPQLEDQLASFTSDFDRDRAGYSPDRLDALVWGVHDLVITPTAPVAASGVFYGPYGGPDERQRRIDGMKPEQAVQRGFLSKESAVARGLVTKERAEFLGWGT